MIKKGSLAEKVYKEANIAERHRHRFEYNNQYKEQMEEAGLTVSGTSPDGKLVEIVEIQAHPFFIALTSSTNSGAGLSGLDFNSG